MQSKIIWLVCLVALAVAPVVLAEDLFFVGENDDDRDAPRGYTLFSTAEDSAFLGVTMEEETEHEEGGARIASVVDDSPAAKAGLHEGDIVVGFGGDTVRGPVSLTKKIRDHEPGDTVKITVLRDGRRESFDVELGERSTHWGSGYSVAPHVLQQLENIQIPDIDLGALTEQLEGLNLEHLQGLEHLKELEGMNFNFDFKNLEEFQDQLGNAYSFDCEDGDCTYNNLLSWSTKPLLGVQLTDTTPELREHLGGSRDAGVLVGKVIKASAAEDAGVEVGDLIVSVGGDEIGSTGDLRRALAHREGQTFDVVVIRDGRSTTLSVTLDEQDEERPSGPRAAYRVAPRPAAPAPPVAPVIAVPPRPSENVI
jgi:membrane-associated protease RseP (regulator of RpoE activity)